MKAIYKVTEKLTIEVEADSNRGLFERLADIDKIFGFDYCPITKSKDLIFVIQKAGKYTYYEIRDKHNPECRMQFSFRTDDQEMYPRKRKDTGKYWYKYTGDDTQETTPKNKPITKKNEDPPEEIPF